MLFSAKEARGGLQPVGLWLHGVEGGNGVCVEGMKRNENVGGDLLLIIPGSYSADTSTSLSAAPLPIVEIQRLVLKFNNR